MEANSEAASAYVPGDAAQSATISEKKVINLKDIEKTFQKEPRDYNKKQSSTQVKFITTESSDRESESKFHFDVKGQEHSGLPTTAQSKTSFNPQKLYHEA